MTNSQEIHRSALVLAKANHVVNVTGIKVSYKRPREHYPVSIRVMIGDKETNRSQKYTKLQEVSWDLKEQFSSELEITIVIREHHRIKRRDRCIQTTISIADMIMKPVFVVDELNGGAMSLSIHCDTAGPFVELVRRLVEEAQGRLSSMKHFIEQLGKVCDALNMIVIMSEPLGSAYPAAKAAVSAAALLYEKCNSMQLCHAAATKLMEEVADFISFTEIPPERCKSLVTTRTAEALLDAFGEISRAIINNSSETILGFLLTDRLNEVNSYTEKFKRLKDTFDWCVKTEIWETVLRVEAHTANLFLTLLRPVHSAFFDNKEACFEGTRKDTLAIIEQWYASDSRVFWLHGSKGSGKSAIAHTVSKLFGDRFCLAGCFFFNEGREERHDLNRVIPTIAYQLAKRYNGYYSNIQGVLNGHGELLIHTSPDRQLELLLKRPLAEISESSAGNRPPTHSPLVIVLDAVELCCDSEPMKDDRESLRNLMAGFLRGLANVVPWLKIFVSSGWNPSEIYAVQKSLKGISCQCLDISDPFIDLRGDILAYVSHYEENNACIAEESLDLEYKASNLFKRIRQLPKHLAISAGRSEEDSSVDLSEQLRMDRLFRVVILGVMHGWKNAESALPLIREILAVAHCIAISAPLTERVLVHFLQPFPLGTTADIIRSAVSSLFPILSRDGDSLRILFPPRLFLDFVGDENRSGSFAMDMKPVRNRMARHCLDEMDRHLRFNISGPDSPYLPCKEVQDLAGRIESCIPETLRYCCLYWMDLVIECGDAQALSKPVTEFLQSPKILLWLEILSLIGKLEMAERHLSKCIDFFKEHHDICKAAKELDDFVSISYMALKFSAPHAYISALAWLPNSSFLVSHILHFVAMRTKPAFESSASQETTENRIGSENGIVSVACSLDGNRIVSGHRDGALNIWDGPTGARVHGPLRGHSNFVRCIAFSLDGSRFISGAFDGLLRIWDSLSGELVSGLIISDSAVLCAAFSPDGTRFVSGHDDGSIWIWDAQSGDAIVDSSERHSGLVSSVAYSPDGSRIVTGSFDNTMRIWDAETGKSIGTPLRGHTDRVRAVAYSPGGSRIVSASYDKTVRVWDAQTGERLGEPLWHNDWVRNVAYSRDGSRILSSSDGGMICIWDSNNGAPIGVVPRNESRWDPENQCFVSIQSWWPSKCAPNVQSLVYSANPLYVPDDGWIRTLDGGLLLWVPHSTDAAKATQLARYSSIPNDEQDESISISEWRKLVQGKDWARMAGVDRNTCRKI